MNVHSCIPWLVRVRTLALTTDIIISFFETVGRDGSVAIATRYGLDGPGSNPGGGEIFRPLPDRPWDSPSLLYNGYGVSSQRVKRLGRGVDHPPPSSAEVKERGELYLYSPPGLPSKLVQAACHHSQHLTTPDLVLGCRIFRIHRHSRDS